MANGAGGRPRTPTGLKVLRGESRRSRLPPKDAEGKYREPRPELGAPQKPPGLSPRAGKYWDLALAELGNAGVLYGADSSELRIWAEAMSRYEHANELLESTGPLISGRRDGEVIKSPLHQVVRDNARLAHELARSLGLNPSGRASLITGSLPGPTPPPGPRAVEDPIADLLNPRRLAAKRAASSRRATRATA